jgi:hypothetical protein
MTSGEKERAAFRCRPPEDCGGEMDYEHLLEVLADPEHEESLDLRQWGGDFDPERVDAQWTTGQMREYN